MLVIETLFLAVCNQKKMGLLVVFVTGCPEAGKSCVAQTLAHEFGLAYCSPGDWLRLSRDEPTALGEFIARNYTYERLDLLVTDYVAVKVKEALLLLPNGNGIVVDGFPRTRYQSSMLGSICLNTPMIVFNLDNVTRDESIRRALSKQWRAPFGFVGVGVGAEDYHATTPNDAGRRYDVYEASQEGMISALGKGKLHVIDASLDEQLVLEQCRETMESSDGTLVELASLGEPETPVVASHIEAAVVLQTCMRIANLTDDSSRCRFVGSHPVSLQRRHFAQLIEHHYVVSRKMNGERALLLVMNGRFWMVLRNFVVWRSRWDAYLQTQQKNLWLLDAEWIEATKTFCIIDVCSQDVAHLPILRRIHTLAENPLLSVLSLCFNKCRVYVQRYFAFADFRMIERPQSEEMDGYIFTPQSLPYRYGRDANMFKAKELKNNSADLQVDSTGRLYVKDTDKGSLEVVGELVNFDASAMPVNSILECIPVDDKAQRWYAQKLRSDKLEPNEAWVFRRVVESIKENVTFQEIADLEGVR